MIVYVEREKKEVQTLKQIIFSGYRKRNAFSLILLCVLSGIQSPFIKLIEDNRLSEAAGSENNFIRLSWNAFIIIA